MMIDGTLLKLPHTPESKNAANYQGTKFLYSLTVNVFNDDNNKIRASLARFPGSKHDNHVWKNDAISGSSPIFLVHRIHDEQYSI